MSKKEPVWVSTSYNFDLDLTCVWFDDRVFDKLDLGFNKTIKFTNKVLNNRKLALLGLISHLILMKPKLTICGLPRTSLVRSPHNWPIHFKLPDYRFLRNFTFRKPQHEANKITFLFCLNQFEDLSSVQIWKFKTHRSNTRWKMVESSAKYSRKYIDLSVPNQPRCY